VKQTVLSKYPPLGIEADCLQRYLAENISMRKTLFFIFIIACMSLSAQTDKQLDSLRRSIKNQVAETESLRVATDSLLMRNARHNDSAEMARFAEQNSRSLNSMVRMMKEREEKAKRQMWLRIGLGVLFLAVLIIGLARKRKTKGDPTN
jgi:hypothetical protein